MSNDAAQNSVNAVPICDHRVPNSVRPVQNCVIPDRISVCRVRNRVNQIPNRNDATRILNKQIQNPGEVVSRPDKAERGSSDGDWRGTCAGNCHWQGVLVAYRIGHEPLVVVLVFKGYITQSQSDGVLAPRDNTLSPCSDP
uniref:Uncharacterized protein n=1 Tax=Candidatus Kentrum sp. MB TaxID=2138164 RepID=A0A450X0W0_9GAMM|nr:MAG: hypothetical protein BECKMB1821G_GA0114241_100343 [Candidatus Kentron sp. MB]